MFAFELFAIFTVHVPFLMRLRAQHAVYAFLRDAAAVHCCSPPMFHPLPADMAMLAGVRLSCEALSSIRLRRRRRRDVSALEPPEKTRARRSVLPRLSVDGGMSALRRAAASRARALYHRPDRTVLVFAASTLVLPADHQRYYARQKSAGLIAPFQRCRLLMSQLLLLRDSAAFARMTPERLRCRPMPALSSCHAYYHHLCLLPLIMQHASHALR